MLRIILSIFLTLSPVSGFTKTLENFAEAKKIAKQIYKDHKITFYCGCSFDNHNQIDKKCSKKFKQEQKYIDWEHIVTAKQLGSNLECWDKNSKVCEVTGRKCCQKVSKEFRKRESDLHNLVPAIPFVNKWRGSDVFNEIKECNYYEKVCTLKKDKITYQIEPDDTLKGFIARVHLYMIQKYNLKVDKEIIAVYEKWNKEFPPDDWEIERNKRIKKVQGDSNLYIDNYLVN